MAINSFFNADLYLSRNPDLVRAGLHTEEQLWDHYVQYGAQESTSAEVRAPNTWFDVNYYLANYPDLAENGITAASALDHYRQYGVNEGRSFNPNPVLAPDNFDAVSYAQENEDLREAFGIEDDFSELTEAQQAELLTHYLSYGYEEDRPGVNADFAEQVQAGNDIDVDAYFEANPNAAAIQGTIGDDVFTVNGDVSGKTIDGLGGADTVHLGADAQTGGAQPAEGEEPVEATDDAVYLRNVESLVVEGAATVRSNQLVDVELGAEATELNLEFDAAAVAGADDELTVDSAANEASITVNGIETVNLDLGADVSATTLQADAAKGDTLTVNVSGGAAGATSNDDEAQAGGLALELESKGSTALTQLVVDGSALTGALDLRFADEAEITNIKNMTVIGSAADVDQDFSALAGSVGEAAEGFTLTVTGGAGDDSFASSAAIDTLTGGKGANTFTLSAENSTVLVSAEGIKAMDTITDFKAGDAVTGLEGLAIVTDTGVAPEGASFEDLISGSTGLADGNVFGFEGDSYILVATAEDIADVQLVKLAGVDVEKLAINDDGGLAFA